MLNIVQCVDIISVLPVKISGLNVSVLLYRKKYLDEEDLTDESKVSNETFSVSLNLIN